MRKSLLVAGAVTAVGLSSIVGVGVVSAQSASMNGQDDLVSAIAQKFNLNKTDVQKVFDDNRTQHEADRQQKFQDRVNQGVKDGKLTQTQADQLTSKLKELQSFHDSLKGKTPAERHQAMQTEFTQLKQWMTDNKIPQEFQFMGGMHMGMMQDDQANTSATQSN